MESADILDAFADLLAAKSESDLMSGVKKASIHMGFENSLFAVEIKRPLTEPIQHVSSGYPIPWQKRYQERAYSFVDPTVEYCRTNTEPVVWSMELFNSEASIELWEEARGHGLGYGITIPAHDFNGATTMLSLARDQRLAQAESLQIQNRARVLANCVHFAIVSLVVPNMRRTSQSPLTARELECLKWAAQGKTSWEIGSILHVSENTAIFHLKNIMRKLGVANRTQAIAQAMALGLLN